jgi:hypothetical protein
VRLVVVGGLPGTGKSTVAAAIADTLDYALLRSDEVRKDITGTEHFRASPLAFGDGIYDPVTTDRTYAAVLDRSQTLLERGSSVVVDASWTDMRHRRLAAELADRTTSDLIQLRCDLPEMLAASRIARRREMSGDVSDADEAITRRMAGRADPWPEAVTLQTADDPATVAARALAIVASEG